MTKFVRVLSIFALVVTFLAVEAETKPADAAVSTTAVKATAGFTHGCALMSDGTVRCFGKNGSGQLGNGVTSTSQSVSLVSGITDAIDVGVNPGNFESSDRSCALLATGQIHCWGTNSLFSKSYLGTGDSVSRYLLPTPVCRSGSTSAGTCVPLTNVVQMSIDGDGGCGLTSTDPAVTTDNRVYCWGNVGFTTLNAVAICTSGAHSTSNCVELTKVTKIDSNMYHRCGVTSDDMVYCWGDDNQGVLGRESAGSYSITAAPITDGGVNITDAIDVATGGRSTCIIRRPISAGDNRIQCVGSLYFGQLGDGVGDVTTNARRVTWRDICGHSRSVPSTSSCSTTQLPGSPTKLIGGYANMCAYIPNGYGTGDNGWSCWSSGVYLARPSSSGGTVYGYIGQICKSSNSYSVTGQCGGATRFNATEVDVTGSTFCGVLGGAIYCWGMAGGGSIIGQSTTVDYPLLIPMSKSMRSLSSPTGVNPGVAFGPQPAIQLVSELGADLSTSGVTVTASLTVVSGSGALSGTTTATTNASGVATFTDLGISAVGRYVVAFSATSYGSLGELVVVTNLISRSLSITTSYSSSYAMNAAIPDVAATASAGSGAISYESLTGNICTLSGASITAVTNGTCTVRATIASDGTYLSAVSPSVSFGITRVSRTISIDSNSYLTTYTLPATGPVLQATVSAGSGQVSFASLTAGVCQVASMTGAVTFTANGTCSIEASVPIASFYTSATSTPITITVNPAPLVTTTTVSPSNNAVTTPSSLPATSITTPPTSVATDGDIQAVVSDEASIIGLSGIAVVGDGSTFAVNKSGSITLKLWTGYIGSASGSVKASYKVNKTTKKWSCTIRSVTIDKVNKRAKRTSNGWFPKRFKTVKNTCVLPAALRDALKTQKVQIVSRVRFVKKWPTTGKAINPETGAKIPVGIRNLRITIGR